MVKILQRVVLILAITLILPSTTEAYYRLWSATTSYTTLDGFRNHLFTSLNYHRIKPSGKAWSLALGYLGSESDVDSNSLSWTSLQLGWGRFLPSYQFMRPYFLLNSHINFLSSPLDSPMIGFGAQVGFFKQIEENLMLQVALSKHTVNNTSLSPFMLTLGIGYNTLSRSIKRNQKVKRHTKLKKRRVRRL